MQGGCLITIRKAYRLVRIKEEDAPHAHQGEGHPLSDHGDSSKEIRRHRKRGLVMADMYISYPFVNRKTNSQEKGDKSVWTPTNVVSIVWANMALPQYPHRKAMLLQSVARVSKLRNILSWLSLPYPVLAKEDTQIVKGWMTYMCPNWLSWVRINCKT